MEKIQRSTKILFCAVFSVLYIIILFGHLNATNFDPDEYRILQDISSLSFNEYVDSKPGYGKIILIYAWLNAKLFGVGFIELKYLTIFISILIPIAFVYVASRLQKNFISTIPFLFAAILIANPYNLYYFRWGMFTYSLSILYSILAVYFFTEKIKCGVSNVKSAFWLFLNITAAFVHVGLLIFFAAFHLASVLNEKPLKEIFKVDLIINELTKCWYLVGFLLFLILSADALQHINPRDATKNFSYIHSDFSGTIGGYLEWVFFCVKEIFLNTFRIFPDIKSIQLATYLFSGTLILISFFYASKNHQLRQFLIVLGISLFVLVLLSSFGFYRFGILRYQFFLEIVLLYIASITLNQLLLSIPLSSIKPLQVALIFLVLIYGVIAAKSYQEVRSKTALAQDSVMEKLKASGEFSLVDRHFKIIADVEHDDRSRFLNIGYQQKGFLAYIPLDDNNFKKINNLQKIEIFSRYRFDALNYPYWFKKIETEFGFSLMESVLSPGGNYYLYVKSENISTLDDKLYIYPKEKSGEKIIKGYLVTAKKIDRIYYLFNDEKIRLLLNKRTDLKKKFSEYPETGLIGFEGDIGGVSRVNGTLLIEYMDGTVNGIPLP